MLDLLTIALEAHSDERNHHRRYELAVGRDLLGDWVVTVRYGRVGWPLRELRFGSQDVETARSIFADRLRRRLSAPRRIQCRYRLASSDSSAAIDRLGWMSPEMLGQFAASSPVMPGAGRARKEGARYDLRERQRRCGIRWKRPKAENSCGRACPA